MAKLMIPGPCGHEPIDFDPTDHPSVREAMERLDDLVKNHKMIVGLKNPGDKDLTRQPETFDLSKVHPEAEIHAIPHRTAG